MLPGTPDLTVGSLLTDAGRPRPEADSDGVGGLRNGSRARRLIPANPISRHAACPTEDGMQFDQLRRREFITLHGGSVAARRARAAAGPGAADRCADAARRERSGRTASRCGVRAGPRKTWVDGRSQSFDRLSLEHPRSARHQHSPAQSKSSEPRRQSGRTNAPRACQNHL
jgi:hypothetical protein